MNQLENKAKTNRNGNGSQIAGVDTSADNQVGTDHSQMEDSQMEHSHMEQAQADHSRADQPQSDPHFSLRSLRAEAEIYAISRTLEYTGWNRRRAAQLLSISYRGILYKIRQHNLTPGPGREVVPALEQTVKVD
jgi:DNA-binding NtrC family response regulator